MRSHRRARKLLHVNMQHQPNIIFAFLLHPQLIFVFQFQLHVEQPHLISAFPFFILGSFLLPFFIDPTLPLGCHLYTTTILPSSLNPSLLSTCWSLSLILENTPFRMHRLLVQQVPITRPKLHQ